MVRPACSCCYDDVFDGKIAEAELRRYRKSGPGRSTRAIAEALSGPNPAGLTVLDIGAGVGGVHHLLIERGAARATDVDASGPYLAAARGEATARGITHRVDFRHGDFVALAQDIEPADLVSLDRVACCYRDVDALIELAARRTRHRLALTVPPDLWVARRVVDLMNLWQWLTRSDFRIFVHPHARIAAAARAGGLEPRLSVAVRSWRLLVYERPITSADGA